MSEKTRIIQIRTTDDQLKRIRNFAKAKGFNTVSAYLRNSVLRNSLILEQQVSEIYKAICPNKKPTEVQKENKNKHAELRDYAMLDEDSESPAYGEI